MVARPDREDVSPDGQEHRVDFEEAWGGIAETRATEETRETMLADMMRPYTGVRTQHIGGRDEAV